MTDYEFEAKLDGYLLRKEEQAVDAAARSYIVASRPDAIREVIPFSELQVGDFITADDVRWVEVIEVTHEGGLVHVLFETPESVILSGETQFWIDRRPSEQVTVDASARK